ncbi:hypothetical protein, partial [Vagococcus fluvialis]|uniref:hypothetical protein n=1 Tax=Vagococcus fluvialis TaxID=2738 RepID=UPI003B5B048E
MKEQTFYPLTSKESSEQIKTSSVNWRFVLRLKASFSGLSLKGSSNGFPHAPHLLANPKRINYQFFLFFSPVNGSYSSNR